MGRKPVLALHAGPRQRHRRRSHPESLTRSTPSATPAQRTRHGKRFTSCRSEGARPKGGDQIVNKIVHDSPDPIRLGGVSTVLAEQIAAQTHLETRATILGHIQRGGPPAAVARVLAMAFGHKALQLVATREWNNVVVMQQNATTFVPLEAVADQPRPVPLDHPLIGMARAVGTCLGD
jgi:6-phosphofructokinase 1